MDHQAVRGPQVKNGCCNPIPMNENSDFMLSYREPMFPLRPRVCVCVCWRACRYKQPLCARGTSTCGIL